MSGDPLYVQPDGVRSYSQIHDEVVAGLSQLMGAAAPEAAGVQTSHGAIASAVSTALSAVLGSRQGTMQATSISGTTISELLQKAAQMYEQGDLKGAATLRAAAEALEGANAPGGPGAAGTGGSGSGGADMMGQMVSQVGQQVGQMAQSVAQPLQGLAQGLQQVPQQVMQGAQQIAQQVFPPAGPAGGKTPGESGNAGDDDGAGPGVVPEGRFPEKQSDEAAAGETADAGRAPDLPRTERAEPAQTRP
jgi:Excreted virulence factor EspC, type VII ESX diderm